MLARTMGEQPCGGLEALTAIGARKKDRERRRGDRIINVTITITILDRTRGKSIAIGLDNRPPLRRIVNPDPFPRG